MLGRGYTVRVARTTTTANDLIRGTAASSHLVAIEKIVVTQGSKVDAVELLRVIAQRQSAAGTGNALTPEKREQGAPTAASTWNDHQTTNGTLTGQPQVDESWNVLAPFVWKAGRDGDEIVLAPSGIWVVRLDTAPGASMVVRCDVEFREIG